VNDAAPSRRSPLDLVALVVGTGLGSGYSPFAPGTAGSAVGLLLFYPLRHAGPLVQVAAVVVGFLVGVGVSDSFTVFIDIWFLLGMLIL
jgi:phosphatidylglycerophosphatase A